MEHKDDEYPISLQLFGANEDDYKRAIEITDLSDFSFIDINMGCPTKKVVKNNGGAGLLEDTDKMISILNAVKSVSPLPVSVKIRLGLKKRRRRRNRKSFGYERKRSLLSYTCMEDMQATYTEEQQIGRL